MAKKLKLWQTISLILVLVIFSLFFSLAFLLFSKSPDFTKPQLQMADNLVGMRYVWQIVGSAQKAENSAQWVSLQIAQTDVMKLVRLGANGADFLAIAGIKIKNFDSKIFEKGEIDYIGRDFKIKFKLYEGIFNQAILAEVYANLQYFNDELFVEVKNAKVGKFSLSENICKKFADRIKAEIIQNKNYSLFQSVVNEIKVDQAGNIVILYNPYKLNRLIKSFRI